MRIQWQVEDPRGPVVLDQVLVFPRYRIQAWGPDLPGEVDIEAVLHNGRVVARSVTCRAADGQEVTAEALRAIPVASILRHAIGRALGTFSPLVGQDPAALRGLGPTPEVLKMVAAVYRMGVLMGGPATQLVSSYFQVPRSTAGRWVQLARQRGHLSAAEGRKRGERKPPSLKKAPPGSGPKETRGRLRVPRKPPPRAASGHRARSAPS